MGEILRVAAPCGIDLDVRLTEVEPHGDGWIGWGVHPGPVDGLLRPLGVPPCDPRTPMRVFDWQVRDR